MTIRYDKERGHYGKRREGQPYSVHGYDQFGQPMCKHKVTAEWCDICNYHAKEYEKWRDKDIANRIKRIDQKHAEWLKLKSKYPQLAKMGINEMPKVIKHKRQKKVYGRVVA